MRPSSFVFVAIVGLWAAHLLPQWIRRRDALGASRGADRYSSALRVLARRTRTRGGGRSSAPLLPSIPVVAAPVVDAPAPGPASRLVPEPSRTATAEVAARRRRRVLLALAGAALLSTLGALAGVVPAGLAVVAVLLLGLDVAALRAAALAGERRRAEAEHTRRAAEADRARRLRLAREAALVRARAEAAPRDEADAAAQQKPVAVTAPAAPQPSGADGTWVPVPVPPPTYTLKPVAPRPQPVPLEPELDPAARPAATVAPQLRLVPAPEVDLDSVLERRRAVND